MGSIDGVRRPTTRARQLSREATLAERRLWTALSCGQLWIRFSRQMPVGPYICDFLSRRAMIVVEVDGDSLAGSVDHDARRDLLLQAQGLRVLRFSNANVMSNLEGVVHVIRMALADSPTPDPSREREGSF